MFRELWNRVRERKVGTIVVAELSRLSHGMRTLVNLLYDCFENGVVVVSIREGWLEEAMKNEIARPIIVAVFAILYELERKMFSERIKEGMTRAKAQGKHVGRPRKLSEKELREALKLIEMGVPKKRVAEMLGISKLTLYRYL